MDIVIVMKRIWNPAGHHGEYEKIVLEQGQHSSGGLVYHSPVGGEMAVSGEMAVVTLWRRRAALSGLTLKAAFLLSALLLQDSLHHLILE